jgi:hypothetical protein
MADLAFDTKSPTGLVTSGFCYFFNVTAPDLMDPNTTSEPDTCGHGPAGKGATFGAFSYGKTAVLNLSPGLARRFDLLGFKRPAGTSAVCEDGNLEFRVVSDSGSGSKVQVFYDNVEIGADPGYGTIPDPATDLYIFSRSAPVTLTTGAQTVALSPIDYEDRTLGGIERSYPKRYSCSSVVPAKLEMSDINFANSNQAQLSDFITVTNTGGIVATAISSSQTFEAGLSYFSGGYPGHTGANPCGNELQPGASCLIKIKFSPNSMTAGETIASGQVALDYQNGDDVDGAVSNILGQRQIAILAMTPAVHNFLSLGASHTFTVTNTGQATADLSTNLTSTNYFKFLGGSMPGTGGTCGATLAPSSSCTYVVQYWATFSGGMNQFLIVDYESDGNAQEAISSELLP